jgi:hypothetical protein
VQVSLKEIMSRHETEFGEDLEGMEDGVYSGITLLYVSNAGRMAYCLSA